MLQKFLTIILNFLKLKKNINKVNREIEKLIKRLNKDAINKQLHADKLIDKLFKSGKNIYYTETNIEQAKLRSELGNPPGKKGSIGDAINWELLLENILEKTDLYLVSEDGDFASKIDSNRLSDFLNDEWVQKKKSKIYFYRSFTDMINNIFTTIKLKNEQLTENLIENLENSYSFDKSRSILAQLNLLNNLTDLQLSRILEASFSNNQIYMANDYSPNLVINVLKKLIEGREYKLKYDIYIKFCAKYGITPKIDEDF
jgi:hypothetical protein